ncbi:MAG: hypothetical protein ACRDIY_01605 [Chloroflexota bacterium]
MNAELRAIVENIRSLASQRGWTAAAGLADALLAEDWSSVLVVAPSDVDARAFERWLAALPIDGRITSLPLDRLLDDPGPAILADRVVAWFACGRLLDANQVEAVARGLFPRSIASYGVVLGQAETIEGPEQLEAIERGAWRLLVARPIANWRGQDLLDHRCFFWSDRAVPSFSRGRVERDTTALTDWLTSPPQRGGLARTRTLALIDLAEAAVSDGGSAADAPICDGAEARRLDRAVADLRRRLLHCFDAQSLLVQRELSAASRWLELDAIEGLPSYLDGRLPALGGSLDADQSRELVLGYLTSVGTRWQADATRLLVSHWHGLAADLDNLLHDVDWPAINRIAADHGETRTFPGALVDELLPMAEVQAVLDGAPRSIPVAPERDGRSLPIALGAAVVGAAVLSVSLFAFGAQPLLRVALGASGVVGGGLMTLRLRRDRASSDAESSAREAVVAALRAADERAREQTAASLAGLRERLVADFRQLEDALRAGDPDPEPAPALATRDRQLLDDFRQAIGRPA